MTRRTYWGIAALIVVLIAASGFIYYQWSQMQQFKEELAQDKKLLEEKDKPVAENDLPPAKEGFKWVPHGDHHHQVPIDAPDTWQETHQMPVEEVQVESVVIDGVGDLKEWLSFFESFGDDSSLEELYEKEFIKKSIQYGEAMRGFDYENMSPEVAKLVKQISEKRTSLGYIKGAKSAAARAEYNASQRANAKPERYLLGPIKNEGGDE